MIAGEYILAAAMIAGGLGFLLGWRIRGRSVVDMLRADALRTARDDMLRAGVRDETSFHDPNIRRIR